MNNLILLKNFLDRKIKEIPEETMKVKETRIEMFNEEKKFIIYTISLQ